MILSLMI